jgi:hypothetical protein
MPVGECCADGDCGVSPHAVTGWCLASTGAPVLVLTTLACPEGFDDPGVVTITLIDPANGSVLPQQAIVACGDKDWEVNQLCDYDMATGALIATFIQVFEWDEDTGVLIISLVRADNPAIPYVPVGQVRACTDDESHTDVEVTEFCYTLGDDPVHGWQAWVFLDGVYTVTVYFDAFGAILVAPTIVECPQLATEETLVDVLEVLNEIDTNTDGLEACCSAGNALLTLIHADVDGVEGTLISILGAVDELEACCAAGNALLTAIESNTDDIESLLGSIIVLLTAIGANTDGIEGYLATLVTVVRAEDSPHVSGHFGIPVWGVRNDSAATRTDLDGDYIPIATDGAGRVGIADLGGSITVDGSLSIAPTPSGGTSIYRNLDVNATGLNIKASGGRLHSVLVTNRANAERFLKLYNTAGAPTVGVNVPVMTIPLDGKTGGGQTALTIDLSIGAEFTLGIGIAATTGILDADVGNPGANNVVANIFYA